MAQLTFKGSKSRIPLYQHTTTLGGDNSYKNINGLSYKGKNKDPLWNHKDTPYIEQEIENKQKRANKAAVFKAYDDNGKEIKNGIHNIGGRMFRSNEEGIIRIVNTNYVDEVNEEFEEKEKYFVNVAKKFKTLESMSVILGMSVDEVSQMCAPGGLEYFKLIKASGMYSEIDNVNCSPLICSMYPAGSQQHAYARAKLILIAKALCPILDNPTGAYDTNRAEAPIPDEHYTDAPADDAKPSSNLPK